MLNGSEFEVVLDREDTAAGSQSRDRKKLRKRFGV